MIDFKKLIRSFRCAFNGIKYLSREQNFFIETCIGILVILLALILKISHYELVAVMLIVLLILVLEIINTIFERIIDILQPRLHPFARVIKDMMAGAVLITCFFAAAIGYVIFGHYLFALSFFI